MAGAVATRARFWEMMREAVGFSRIPRLRAGAIRTGD
jgi:hypothetical protein